MRRKPIRRRMLPILVLLSIFPLGIHSTVLAEIPPPPELLSPEGEQFDAEHFDNQVLLVNFWATWCAPCRVEMPDLNELQSHFDDQEFAVVGVAGDEIDAVTNYLKSVPVDYPIYVGDPDEVFAWSERLGNRILGLPFSALLDKSRKIRWVKMGGRISVEEMEPLITRLLDETPSSGAEE